MLRILQMARNRNLDLHPLALRSLIRNERQANSLRGNPQAADIFMDLLCGREPDRHRPGSHHPDGARWLRVMNETGFLGRYLPDWARIVGVNQTGYFYGMRACIPSMEARGGGAIVNVASVAGLVGMQNVFTYSATKGAVIAMSRQAAITLAPKKIRVNVICPGIIETPILGDITPELKAYCESMTPLQRLGQPIDIGATAVHFARNEASFITGQVIAIDGGWTAQ